MRVDIKLGVGRGQLFRDAPAVGVVGRGIAGVGIGIDARIDGGPEATVIEAIGVVVDHAAGIAEERRVDDALPVGGRHHRMRNAARQIQDALPLVLPFRALRVVDAHRDVVQPGSGQLADGRQLHRLDIIVHGRVAEEARARRAAAPVTGIGQERRVVIRVAVLGDQIGHARAVGREVHRFRRRQKCRLRRVVPAETGGRLEPQIRAPDPRVAQVAIQRPVVAGIEFQVVAERIEVRAAIVVVVLGDQIGNVRERSGSHPVAGVDRPDLAQGGPGPDGAVFHASDGLQLLEVGMVSVEYHVHGIDRLEFGDAHKAGALIVSGLNAILVAAKDLVPDG